jgi:hypothetical protein
MKNYLKYFKEKKVLDATSKELQETYSFIPGIKDVKGNYYSKISKIIELMVLYAKNNGLIDEEEYKTCISLKNESYEGLKGTLGDISMIINEKDFIQAEQSETLSRYDPLHQEMLNTLNEQFCTIFVGDPDLENLIKYQK